MNLQHDEAQRKLAMKVIKSMRCWTLLVVAIGCNDNKSEEAGDASDHTSPNRDADNGREVALDTDTVTDAEAGTDTDTDTDTDADTNTKTNGHIDTVANTEPIVDTNANTGAEGDSDTDPDGDAGDGGESAADTVNNTNPDGDTGDDGDSEAGRDAGGEDRGDAGTGLEAKKQLAISYILNPYEGAPLAAVAKASHDELIPADVVEIQIVIKGIDDEAADLIATLDPASSPFQTHFDVSEHLEANEVGVPVLGLYQDHVNEVRIEIRTETELFEGEIAIPTEPVPAIEDEVVTIHVADIEQMEPGWTYLNQRVYDNEGHCRWVGPQIYQIRSDGNILHRIDDKSWLGKPLVTRESNLPAHLRWHHDSIELPNGNIVGCINNDETEVFNNSGQAVTTKGDYIVELSSDTQEIVNAWDMREFLDVDRGTVIKSRPDWLHMNTLARVY